MAQANKEFALYCCDLLACLGPCLARPMFGGWGISTDGLTVAIVADLGGGETLWLKSDDETRPIFEAAGCARFTYAAKGVLRGMNYYSAPEDAMESPALMASWARLAMACALKAQATKPVAKRTATRPTTAKKPKPKKSKTLNL